MKDNSGTVGAAKKQKRKTDNIRTEKAVAMMSVTKQRKKKSPSRGLKFL